MFVCQCAHACKSLEKSESARETHAQKNKDSDGERNKKCEFACVCEREEWNGRKRRGRQKRERYEHIQRACVRQYQIEKTETKRERKHDAKINREREQTTMKQRDDEMVKDGV